MKINDSKKNLKEPTLIFKKDAVLTVKTPGRSKLNVRAAPDVGSPVCTAVDHGSRLDVEWIQEKDWVKVKTSDNIVGYCLLQFLEP